AMRGQETVKESNPAARPGAQSAMRGLTRYFRAAVARKYSVCPRIARQGQSGRLSFVQSTSPRCEDKSKNAAIRGRLCDFFTFSCPRIAPKNQSGRHRSAATQRTDRKST